jgi:phosphatidylinositol-3-phosphatase
VRVSRRVAVLATAVAVAVLALAVTLAGCGASSRRFGPVQRTPAPVARPAADAPIRVALIVMENEEYGDIIGSAATPYINSLARRYALASSMFAISHPSLPNYLALTAGSTFGINSDCTDCSVAATSLPGQLSAAGISWQAFMEDLPRPCFTGPQAGQYAKKHDPFLYFRPLLASSSQCAHVVGLPQLAAEEHGHSLPRFIWITPNLCHDMHDCSPAVGDRFLATLVPSLLASLGRNGLLFLTWDEGSSNEGCCRLAAGGHVVTILAGPGARRATRLRTPVDHYSTLQTIEDLLGLPRLRAAACPCTPSLAPLLAPTETTVRTGSPRRSSRYRSTRGRGRS